MFKKTLAAAAILGAFAGSAFAADVTLYGVVDTGLDYVHTTKDGADSTDDFTMKTGQNAGNRWGLKGVEDLGNGMKVGFVLESGFNADDGTLDNDGRLFGREAKLYVQGAFGHLSFGRTGQIMSGAGGYAVASKIISMGTGIGSVGSGTAVFGGNNARWDNMITYQTPSFAGFQVTAQYSMQGNTVKEDGVENKSSSDRYYGIGATYKVAGLELVGVVDTVNKKSYNVDTKTTTDPDDTFTATLGGSYDFGVAKVYLAGQYFDHAVSFGKSIKYTGKKDLEGFGVNLGAAIPVAGGTVKALVGYGEAEDQTLANKPEVKLYQAAAAYLYPLSKRTTVWGAAGYNYMDYNKAAEKMGNVKSTSELTFGMTHTF